MSSSIASLPSLLPTNAASGVLDADETTPSLHVHQLKGQQAGLWTAYASKSLRITFERLEGGRKRLIEASQHYGD